MFGGSRRKLFATGLAAGLAVALLLFLVTTAIYHQKQQSAAPLGTIPTRGEQGAEDPNTVGNTLAYRVDSFFSLEDTVAQSVMTVFSIIAAILLWQTLRATQAMATDQARIGEAQVRAYLSIKAASYALDGEAISVDVTVTNTGQSPASHVWISGGLIVHEVIGGFGSPRVISWVTSRAAIPNRMEVSPIAAGGTETETLYFFWPDSFDIEEDDDIEQKKSVFMDGNEIHCEISVSWMDVFRKDWSIDADANAVIDAHPGEPKKRRDPTGGMSVKTRSPEDG